MDAQAGPDSRHRADVLWDCPSYDLSAWPGHPFDTRRSDGVTSTESASHILSVVPLGAVSPQPNTNEGMTMTTLARGVTGGVDTHLDVHEAAALDDRGASLASRASTTEGYKLLLGG